MINLNYIAGYFDGEGCVRITTSGGYFGIHVFITNTYKPLLLSLEESFGGKTTLRDKKTDKHRTCFQWRISNKKEALSFLEKNVDHAVEKKNQIELAIEFCKIPDLKGNAYSKGDPLLKERKQEIAVMIKSLKKIDYGEEVCLV